MTNLLYTEITRCRSCGSNRLDTVLDLGDLYISGWLKPGEEGTKAPLELVYCADCSLVQSRHTVDRNRLYRENYGYRSGLNESMVVALKDVVEDASRRVSLEEGDYVLDIGSNDGTLLSLYPDNLHRHGFEPNYHLAIESLKRPNDIITVDFFPAPSWKAPKEKYKVITSIAQMYNVDDLDAYVAAIKRILHPEGVWLVQMQDLEGMLDCNGFDNICHEHLCYFSQEAFMRLLDRHGLYVYGASRNNVNGSSVRYVVRYGLRQGRGGIDGDRFRINHFARRIATLKAETVSMLQDLKTAGKTVLGYAASTKGNTLLQYYGITPDLLPAIADRNPDKWGKVTVGTGIPVISEEEMRERKPDCLFILAWHFGNTFRRREQAFLAGGGKFIVPLPVLRTIGGEACARLLTDRRYVSDSVSTSSAIP